MRLARKHDIGSLPKTWGESERGCIARKELLSIKQRRTADVSRPPVTIPSASEGSLMNNSQFAVYIMASLSGTIYTGFTTNLVKRVWEHKNDVVRGFTRKYECHKLVYYELCDSFAGALAREKEIKGWGRKKKETLIKTMNPTWKDLYSEIL